MKLTKLQKDILPIQIIRIIGTVLIAIICLQLNKPFTGILVMIMWFFATDAMLRTLLNTLQISPKDVR